jgi:integrase
LSIATLGRRLVSISRAHETMGVHNPTGSPLVRATMHGIKRTFGIAQRQAKPLLADDIRRIIGGMGKRPKDVRDRALLLIGFAGAFRRSELVALNIADIERHPKGIVIHIRRSKTDQVGAGRAIGIPFGSRRGSCPVTALDRWLALSRIADGAIFRRVDRHGNISNCRMSGEAVSLVVKARLAAAGMNPTGYSGHSLRAGFVTSAALAGEATWKIRRQTGHKSATMLDRYIRDETMLGDAATSSLV